MKFYIVERGQWWKRQPGAFFQGVPPPPPTPLLNTYWKLSEVLTILHIYSNEKGFIFCFVVFCFSISQLFQTDDGLRIFCSLKLLTGLLCPYWQLEWSRDKSKGMILLCSEYSNSFYQIQDKGQRPHIGLQSPKLFISCFLSNQSTLFSSPIPLGSSELGRPRTASGSLLPGLPFPQAECASLITSFRSLNKCHLKEDFL